MKIDPYNTALQTFIERFKKLPGRYQSALLLLLILALFFTFNKLAFQSYFSDDDFDNLRLAALFPWWAFPKSLFTLALQGNFRPVGVIYYKLLGGAAGFNFGAYVVVLQAFHVATALLLWLFLRRLGLRPVSAALGCAFFTLHMSILPAYWKPMYIFEVLCGFWLVLALLFYQRDRFFLSFLCAWFAFKSKEMELMLPVLLLLYEWQFGQDRMSGRRQWKQLIPFFLMSLGFGLQSLMLKGPETSYTLHLTPQAFWSAIDYYSTGLLYAPFSGLIISIALLCFRLRIITFGVLGFWILMFPMFGFPGRQFSAYLYVPLLAFSVAVAGVAQWRGRWALLFLVIWIPASYDQLRIERNPLLAYHHEHLPYVTQVRNSLAAHPVPKAVIYEGTPKDFNVWGPESLFSFATGIFDLPVYRVEQPEALEAVRRPGAVLYSWDAVHHRLHTNVFPGEGHDFSYVDFGLDNPIWQLKSGWKPLAGDCRWIAPLAVITLRQPPGDLDFILRVNLGPGQAESLHQVLRVASDGQTLGEYRFTKSGFQTLSWPVSSGAESVKTFDITLDPAFVAPDRSRLGVVIYACGFLPRGSSAPRHGQVVP